MVLRVCVEGYNRHYFGLRNCHSCLGMFGWRIEVTSCKSGLSFNFSQFEEERQTIPMV